MRFRAAALTALLAAGRLAADENPPRDWSLHVQSTYQVQTHGGFDAPYEGANSFQNRSETRGSFTTTFYAGRRLWTGGEAYVNVELIAGEGLSKVLGLAGPPNGETYRVDSTQLKANLARLFLRQTFDLGGARDGQEDDQNRLQGPVPSHRLVVTAGKFSGTDVFDDNTYAHEPRTQFNTWSLWANAAWDYPADTRGYTWGVAAALLCAIVTSSLPCADCTISVNSAFHSIASPRSCSKWSRRIFSVSF